MYKIMHFNQSGVAGLPLPLRRLVFGRNADRNFGYLRFLARLRVQQRMRGWEEEGVTSQGRLSVGRAASGENDIRGNREGRLGLCLREER